MTSRAQVLQVDVGAARQQWLCQPLNLCSRSVSFAPKVDRDTDLEVTVTIRPIPSELDRKLGVELGWPEGFFAETAGALASDDSFIRHPQGDYEVREPLD